MTRLALLAGLASPACVAGCGRNAPAGPAVRQDALPMVLLVLDGLTASMDLPWGLGGLTRLPLAMGRLSDEHEREGFDPGAALVSGAVAAQRLVFSLDQPMPEAYASRENILVTTVIDSLGTAHPYSTPSDITPDLSGFDWTSVFDRCRAGAGIFSKYLPDLLVMRFETGSPDTALQAAGIWLAAAESLHCCVAVVSTPRPPEYRGWFAIAGPGVRSSRPLGITPTGLVATLSILSGLPWTPSVLEGTPAAGALEFDPWSDRGMTE